MDVLGTCWGCYVSQVKNMNFTVDQNPTLRCQPFPTQITRRYINNDNLCIICLGVFLIATLSGIPVLQAVCLALHTFLCAINLYFG